MSKAVRPCVVCGRELPNTATYYPGVNELDYDSKRLGRCRRCQTLHDKMVKDNFTDRQIAEVEKEMGSDVMMRGQFNWDIRTIYFLILTEGTLTISEISYFLGTSPKDVREFYENYVIKEFEANGGISSTTRKYNKLWKKEQPEYRTDTITKYVKRLFNIRNREIKGLMPSSFSTAEDVFVWFMSDVLTPTALAVLLGIPAPRALSRVGAASNRKVVEAVYGE